MGTSDPPNHRDNSPMEPSSDPTLTAGAHDCAGAKQISPYRLLRVLGEGGMGEVWLTEQTTPIHRTVALKLIKAGMDTDQSNGPEPYTVILNWQAGLKK